MMILGHNNDLGTKKLKERVDMNEVTKSSILGNNDDCRLSFASSVHHFPCLLKSLKKKMIFLRQTFVVL